MATTTASHLLRFRPRGGRLVSDSAAMLNVYSRQSAVDRYVNYSRQQLQKGAVFDGQQQQRRTRRCVSSASSSSSSSSKAAASNTSSTRHEKRKTAGDDDVSSSSTAIHDNDAGVEAHLDAHFRRVATASSVSPATATTTTASATASAAVAAVPTYALPLIQWYPGHIARAERQLLEQLKLVDVVIEMRDARCPRATAHPSLDEWFATRPGKTRLLVVNREDMVSEADAAAWKKHLGANAIFCNAKTGKGTRRVLARALSAAEDINKARAAKSLRPRAVRAAVLGFPNVGKSALINRLTSRRVCESAPRPGVTRMLRWVRLGGGQLDLLDSPGILPTRIANQENAWRCAVCDDIGEAAYDKDRAAIALFMFLRMTQAARFARHTEKHRSSRKKEKAAQEDGEDIVHTIWRRYKIDLRSYGGSAQYSSHESMSDDGEETAAGVPTYDEVLDTIAERTFNGDMTRASEAIINDYRKGRLGKWAIELP